MEGRARFVGREREGGRAARGRGRRARDRGVGTVLVLEDLDPVVGESVTRMRPVESIAIPSGTLELAGVETDRDPAELREERTRRRETLEPVVSLVDHPDGVLGVDGEVARPRDTSIAAAGAAPLRQKRPGRAELLNPVVPAVGDPHVPRAVDRDPLRRLEVAVLRPEHSPLTEERAGGRELLDPVVPRVRDVDVPARAHGDPRRIRHLTVVRAGAPPLIEVAPGCVELLDPLIGRVRDVQVPVRDRSRGRWDRSASRSCCPSRRTPPGGYRPRRTSGSDRSPSS